MTVTKTSVTRTPDRLNLTAKERAIMVFKGELEPTRQVDPWPKDTNFGDGMWATAEAVLLKYYTGPGIKPRNKSFLRKLKDRLLGPNTSPFTVAARSKFRGEDIIINQKHYGLEDISVITTKIHVTPKSTPVRFKLVQAFLEINYSLKKALKQYLIRRRAIKALKSIT